MFWCLVLGIAVIWSISVAGYSGHCDHCRRGIAAIATIPVIPVIATIATIAVGALHAMPLRGEQQGTSQGAAPFVNWGRNV
ncbi:MAG: hypothetical protein AAF243_00385 [Cyanobacteria bacterium P01_A01_bin.137]